MGPGQGNQDDAGGGRVTLWLGALIAIATASQGAAVEIRLTGYLIETVTSEGGSGGCFDVVERDGWREVTPC